MSVQTNIVIKGWKTPTLLLAIYPLHPFLDQLPDSICSPSLYSLTLCVAGCFHLTQEEKSYLSIDNSLLSGLTHTRSACLSDIIMKCTVSVTNVWIAFGCNHSCLDGTRWKEEREDKGVICLPCFSFPGRATLSASGDLPLWLWHHFLPTPACQD